MRASLYTLPPASTLTITPTHGAVFVISASAGVGASISSATTYGPYLVEHEFEVRRRNTGVIATSDPLAALQSATDIVEAIPATDQTDSVTVWNDEGVLKVSTAP